MWTLIVHLQRCSKMQQTVARMQGTVLTFPPNNLLNLCQSITTGSVILCILYITKLDWSTGVSV